MVVAHKSSSTEIGILRKVFQQYDTKKTGDLCYSEFVAALSSTGYTEEQLKPIFEAVDIDGSGAIRYTEFLAATMEMQGAIREELLAEAFDRLDSDDSGFISAENLFEILGGDFPREEIDAIIYEATGGKSDKISYGEFLKLWEEKREQDREMIIQELTKVDEENESVGSLLDHNEVSSSEARSQFIGNKIAASAKSAKAGSKQVGFVQGIEIVGDHQEAVI